VRAAMCRRGGWQDGEQEQQGSATFHPKHLGMIRLAAV
jgi:hypothetical protein